jgi:hypothetical protein
MEVEERPFTLDEAQSADEAFITSASAFVMPVVEIDGRAGGHRQARPGGHPPARDLPRREPEDGDLKSRHRKSLPTIGPALRVVAPHARLDSAAPMT